VYVSVCVDGFYYISVSVAVAWERTVYHLRVSLDHILHAEKPEILNRIFDC